MFSWRNPSEKSALPAYWRRECIHAWVGKRWTMAWRILAALKRQPLPFTIVWRTPPRPSCQPPALFGIKAHQYQNLPRPLVSHQPDPVGNQSTPIWASSPNIKIGKIENIVCVCELREFYIFKAVLSWILKSINLESSSSNSSLLLISSQLEISIREFPPLFQMYFHSFNIQTSFPLFLLLCETSLDLVGNEKV